MRGKRNKARYLVMDDMDDAVLSLALRDAFPTVVFCASGKSLSEPFLDLRSSVPECRESVITVLFPAPDWQPEFEKYPKNPKWHVIANTPNRYLHYNRTSWFWGDPKRSRWAFDLPTPQHGSISTNYDPDDPEQRAFVNKVWNILKKLTTNRMKSALAKDRVVLSADAGGGMVWAGHHVLEWCAAGPRRMIDGCARPCDDWTPPDTAWYRDLRERAEVMSGSDFGGVPEAPQFSDGT
jgi:hypothetical protein